MTRKEALKFAEALRSAAYGQPEAARFAERLVNAGGDRSRGMIAAEARKAMGLTLPGEIPFDQRFVDRYAVTMSESGGAEIVEASSHLEALKKINPLLGYAGGEWPEYDDALVFLRKHGATFSRDPGHEGFLRKYGSITSPDFPAWDESKGQVMALRSDELMQSVLVYPIVHVELPAESDPLPGWENTRYGRWTRRRDGHCLFVGLAGDLGERLKGIPDGGLRYDWTILVEVDRYRLGDTVDGSTEDLPDAAAAQRAAEAALDRILAAAKPAHPIHQFGGYGVKVGARRSRVNENGIFWASNGSTFVLADSPDRGPWLLGDRRVSLVSIHGNGEIRWTVEPHWPGKDGEEAIEHFGLVPREGGSR